MNIEVIAKIAGVLGFFISVTTFILTRYERRKIIEIELYESSEHDFSDDENLSGASLIGVRFTNLGQRSVILKPESLKISCGKRTFNLAREDYWGKEDFVELMPPNSTREIGIYEDIVLKKLEIVQPQEYTDENFNKLYPFTISVLDYKGKKFNNKTHRYHEASGEFVT